MRHFNVFVFPEPVPDACGIFEGAVEAVAAQQEVRVGRKPVFETVSLSGVEVVGQNGRRVTVSIES